MKIQETQNWLKGRSPCFADPKRQIINPPLVFSIEMQLLFFFPGAYLPSMHFFFFLVNIKIFPTLTPDWLDSRKRARKRRQSSWASPRAQGSGDWNAVPRVDCPWQLWPSRPPQWTSVLSLESSRGVPAAWMEWLCFSDTMEFLFSQFCWEIIYTHQCMSLRQTAWWFGLNILWSDCHNRFSQHPSSCMDAIKRKGKSFLLVLRILRLYSASVFICCC